MLNGQMDYSKDRFYKGPQGFYQLCDNCTPDEMGPFGKLLHEIQKRPNTTPILKSKPAPIKTRKMKIPTKSNRTEPLVLENSYPHLNQEAVKRHSDFNKVTDQFIQAETDMGNSLLESFDTRFGGEQNTPRRMKQKTSNMYYEPAYYQSDCDEIPLSETFSDIAFDKPVNNYRIANDRLDNLAESRRKSKPVRAKSCSIEDQDQRRDQLLQKISRTLGYE